MLILHVLETMLIIRTPCVPRCNSTENDANFSYCSGNEDPGRGFGHIAISVDDVQKACDRFEELGVKFKKRPQDGRMRHIGRSFSVSVWLGCSHTEASGHSVHLRS